MKGNEEKKESATMVVTKEEIEERINPVVERIKPMLGKQFEYSGLVSMIGSDGSITVVSNGGVSITYPVLSESWSIILGWMSRWDEEDARKSFYAFFSYIAFPVSCMTEKFDGQFFDEIVASYVSMMKRNDDGKEGLDEDLLSAIRIVMSDMLNK